MLLTQQKKFWIQALYQGLHVGPGRRRNRHQVLAIACRLSNQQISIEPSQVLQHNQRLPASIHQFAGAVEHGGTIVAENGLHEGQQIALGHGSHQIPNGISIDRRL
jgi:hypothetical protein